MNAANGNNREKKEGLHDVCLLAKGLKFKGVCIDREKVPAIAEAVSISPKRRLDAFISSNRRNLKLTQVWGAILHKHDQFDMYPMIPHRGLWWVHDSLHERYYPPNGVEEPFWPLFA